MDTNGKADLERKETETYKDNGRERKKAGCFILADHTERSPFDDFLKTICKAKGVELPQKANLIPCHMI